jgi:hypothetical protein
VRRLFRAVLAVAAVSGSAAASGQPTCTLAGEHLMSWPTVNPVWQFCWLRPADSSGANGSGLEIRNVYYNGHLVMKRGHVPILNVKYEAGCGGSALCYRDWQFQQDYFIANNILTTHVYAEPTQPPVDVCDQHQGVDVCQPGDANCFDGVAAEKLADHLILTTQFEAGWYRYEMKWTFWLDGRIQPTFGYSAVTDPCVNYNHRHHAYWRFDFDIETPDNNIVTEGPAPVPPGGRPGPRYPIVTLPTEAMRVNNRPGIAWSVIHSGTHRGYRIVPGVETGLPVDTFSVGDIWFLKYHANEIDDSGQSGPPCAIHINGFVNGESTSPDVVVWYRTGWFHAGGDLDDCHRVGPTLDPIGDWSPN